jgi:hypothetical protein
VIPVDEMTPEEVALEIAVATIRVPGGTGARVWAQKSYATTPGMRARFDELAQRYARETGDRCPFIIDT